MQDREQQIAKIKAILSKSTDKAASESEAMNAIKIAKKLMKKYQITDEDIKRGNVVVSDFIFGSNSTEDSGNASSFETLVAVAIAKYTNTIARKFKYKKESSNYSTTKIMFFGHKIDVELAVWMMNVCNDALSIEWSLYKNSIHDKIHGNKIKSFSIGMAQRIIERIDELMVEEQEEDNIEKTKSNAIVKISNEVIVKKQIVEELFEAATNGFENKKSSMIRYVNDDSHSKGYEAGNNVSLHMVTSKPVDENMRIEKNG